MDDMNELKNRYDYIGEFYQGVAIVVKNNLYGAILMGGHEIIPPTYDYISAFKDGYAQAIRKGECKILDLSGRECKRYNGKLIAIPAKYDSVRDFKSGYACVMLDGKWGAIDTECKEIFEPQFYYLSDFVNGTAKYKNRKESYANSWGYLNANGFCSECNLPEPIIEPNGNLIIERNEVSTRNVDVFVKPPTRKVRINNNGQVLISNGDSLVALPKDYLVANNFANGLAVVQDSTGYWGAVNISGKLVIPLQYKQIHNFSENKSFAINKNSKLCLIAANGTIIRMFDTYTDAQSFKNGYAIVYENTKEGIIDGNGKELLAPLHGHIFQTNNSNEFEITSILGCKRGWFNSLTRFLIKPRFRKIIEIKNDFAKVEIEGIGEGLIDSAGRTFIENGTRIYLPDWCLGVKSLSNNIYLGISDNGKWGLVDNKGTTLCLPTFDNIGEVDNDIIPLIKNEKITVGGWRKETKEITKFGLYNVNSKVFIPVEYDTCPEYIDDFYRISNNGLIGAINENGDIILKPEWKQVKFSNGYYIISKIIKENYSEKEKFGLADKKGDIIIEAKYNDIVVLREGLYKIKENNSWSIFNDKCRLTKDSYDEIDLDGDFFIVSKNGLKGHLNANGEKVVMLDDGSYVELPSKFAWGYDFKNGIAKVLINGCENFIDKSFNIVIASENQTIPIDESIDYLVSKDKKGNYIFVQDDKYGIIDHSGKIIIEAKYQSLSHLTDDLYIAGIVKEGDYYSTYGVIDIDDKTILTFEYSSIKPYGGKIPRSYWSWDDEYITEQVEISEDVQHWLVHKNGYGLIDRNGNICIPPEYNDIQKFENGFFVKSNDKYGVIDSNYTIICAPKYSTIKPIGNGLWKVSIITSQTYNNKTEVFGILDSFGKERLEPVYQFIGDVDDDRVAKGRAIINLRGQLGLVDENYCILAEPQYEHISDFKNGKATVNRRIFKPGVPGVTIVRGEIDINGIFTDIEESTKSKINNNTSNSETKTIKTLKNGFVVIQKNDPSPIYQYCAIIDKNNNIILPYKYHRIEEMENGMYLVYLCRGYDGSYGLLDKDFKEVVAPKYAFIRQLQDVFIASISKTFPDSGSNVGLIDSNANVVLQFEYSTIASAGPGLVWIYKDEKIGLATTYGKVLLAPKYGKVEPFENGYAKVNDGHWYEYEEDYGRHSVRTVKEYSEGKWGVINSDGLLILPTVFDSIEITEEGHFRVTKTINIFNIFSINLNHDSNIKVTGLINEKGEELIKDCNGNLILASKRYDWQEDFNAEGRSRVFHNGHVGFVNEQFCLMVRCKYEDVDSELMLPQEYDWGFDSETAYVIIEKNNKKGVLNSSGNLIISPSYDQINVLSDNNSVVFVCGVKDGSHSAYRSSYSWSLLNAGGSKLIDSSKEIIHVGFSLIAVKSDEGKYSILDFNGKRMCDSFFDSVLSFGIVSCTLARCSWDPPKKVEGINYAIVGNDGKYGIIDNHGRLLIQPKYLSLSIQKNNQFQADGVLINAYEQRIVGRNDSVLIIKEDYESVEMLDNGLLLVSKNNLFGCINQIGTIIIPLKYKSLVYQNNLLIAVYYDETEETYKHGVLDFQEKEIVPFCKQIDEIKIESEIILYKQDWHWGAYTLQGQVICEPIYDHIVYVAHNLIKVGMDGKDYESYEDYYWEDGERYDFTNYNEYSIINWGLVDNNGNEILPIEYRAIADKVINGLVEIRSNKKLGYVDITGRILLEPTYKSIGDFIDGYAVVSKTSYYYDEEGRDRERAVYGVINSHFNEIIPCVFASLEYEVETGRFKTDVGYKTIDGRYVAEVDGKELLVDKKYKYCKPFNETCAIAVHVSDGHVKYGLIDKKSNDILPPIFTRLDCVMDELFKFKINELYGLVTSKGNIILQNKYNGIGNFEDNLACVQVIVPSDDRYEQKKLYGYVDSSGNEILPPSYEFIGKRNNKYSVVMKNNLWGIFCVENHHLKIIPNAAFLGPCMDNLCKINVGGIYDKGSKETTGGLWGYVSVDGQIVIEPTYEQAYGFSEGIAAVKLNKKWGFINSEGIFVVPCEYDEVESSFKDGKGELVKDGEVFVFDKKGSQIETYDQPRDEDDYYDGGYYDDTPSIYDNPYYNDNLDMDQQSIEFWNSL